ncbi:MAG: Unknown protein [uncultured Sulfurovum sp.]|uniref:VWFA domain-containing protein n=1 Tax=uncultured Sulfurovum sp. TaxID=269237 RepID=A0A6S6TXU8_9BACT|nr:MAG: Unknown protein [uncultured Sulfurovum sp.]
MAQDLMVLRQQDLVSNPTTRLPVCLCLDVSYSMSGNPIRELHKGVEYFFEAIKSDEIARYSVELSIVVFQSNATTILDFANIDRQRVPSLTADGMTSMGEGVNLALDILEQRKEEYSNKGVDYYQPWMVLMTDGYPTDDTSSAISRVNQLGNNKKLTLFPVAIGDDADINVLKDFSTMKQNAVLKVTSAEYFKSFFEWLSQSVAIVSQSVPGEKMTTPNPTEYNIEIEL